MMKLKNKIYALKLNDDNVGSMNVLLVNDEESKTNSIAFVSPVGYFKEHEEGAPAGEVYSITSSMLYENFYRNKNLMNLQAEVRAENSFWFTQTKRDKLYTTIGDIWKKMTTFKSSQITPLIGEKLIDK